MMPHISRPPIIMMDLNHDAHINGLQFQPEVTPLKSNDLNPPCDEFVALRDGQATDNSDTDPILIPDGRAKDGEAGPVANLGIQTKGLEGPIKNIGINAAVATDSQAEDAEADSENAKLHNIWENSMKDFVLTGKPHRSVAVLMISWIEELDDLKTTEEVNELKTVFEDIFRYQVVKRQLSLHNKKPVKQIRRHLVDFVDDHDNDSTLLIVYYAGHGIPGKPGELHWAGNRQPDEVQSDRNAPAWHDAEPIIRDADGDVLLIFDCCYAGNLMRRDMRGYWPTRSFECLAACRGDKQTNMPGPKSFTSALIWALSDLAKSRQSGFTTHELQQKIMYEAEGFPRDQFVPLLERGDPCDQRLVLAPLPVESDHNDAYSRTPKTPARKLPSSFLDLRFWYSERPDEDEIQNLANSLKKLINGEKIKAKRIGWRGLGNFKVERYARMWRTRVRENVSRKSGFLPQYPARAMMETQSLPLKHNSPPDLGRNQTESMGNEMISANLTRQTSGLMSPGDQKPLVDEPETVKHELRSKLEKVEETGQKSIEGASLVDCLRLGRRGAQGAISVASKKMPRSVLVFIIVFSLSVCAWYGR